MTDPTARELIKQLSHNLRNLHAMVWAESPRLLDEDSGGSVFLDSAIEEVLSTADSYLATPEPAARPTDEELLELADESDMDRLEGERTYHDGTVTREGCWEAWDHQLLPFARAVLARYGHQPPRPIPLTERLPGPEDCDPEEGWFWLWSCKWERTNLDSLTPPYLAALIAAEKVELFRAWGSSVWLPHHALPLPERS